jgi:uncharacterized protein (TIGR02231 family)
MKKYLLFLIIFTQISSVMWAGDEIVLKPTLENVKVFLRGAQLNYTAKVKLEKGLSELVFDAIASGIDRNSINVSAKGDIVIMSVVQRFDYIRPIEKNSKIKLLEDSLEAQNRLMAHNQNDAEVLKAELELLNANRSIGNEKVGVLVTELQKIAEFYRKRYAEIKSKTYELSVAAKRIQKQIDRIQNQLKELNDQLNKPANEVVVTISSNSSQTSEVNLSYLINNAGWQPVYDIRAEKLNSPVMIVQKANVWQNSGFDWKDIAIILSTRNPNVNNDKPELYPWFINFENQYFSQNLKVGGLAARSNRALNAVSEKETAAPLAKSMADYFQAVETQLAVEFTPQIKYSIPDDSKPHTVELQSLSIPAKYQYYSAPRLESSAFLIARLTNWASFNLMPGQAYIYFENSYVGQTSINPETAYDTLSISLGVDRNITVSREVLKDFSEDKFLSSNVERTFAYEIKIKNNKKLPVEILVEDLIPISKNEDIVVKLIESSGARYNAEEGKLKWLVNVDGGKSVVKKLVYSVKYPKDKKIQGL